MSSDALSKTNNFIAICCLILEVQCFWPPPHVIDLQDEYTFEISDDIGLKMDEIVEDGDEMIQEEELSKLKFEKNHHKFIGLHQVVKGIEKRDEKKGKIHPKNVNVFEENFYNEYSEERNIYNITYTPKENSNVQYYNNMTRSLILSNIEEKRQLSENSTENIKNRNKSTDQSDDYNYDEMKQKFEEQIVQEMSTELKYTEMKEYEGVADSLKTIWSKKEDVNCTIAEMRNINGKAILCLLKEPSYNRTSKFFTRLGKICLIWLIVYTIIAVPLWCTRGWCCCCFRCKFCRPRRRIEWIKEQYIKNPVGVIHDDYENRIEYHPTEYEKYYYKNLEKELKKLISH